MNFQQDGQQDSAGDIFASVIALQDEAYHKALAEGREKGHKDGFEEGYGYGLNHGRLLGSEIGEIIGFTNTIEQFLASTNENVALPYNKDRVQKTIAQINDLITKFPFENPSSEEGNLLELMDQIRNKYKLLQIRLGIGINNQENLEQEKQPNNGSKQQSLDF